MKREEILSKSREEKDDEGVKFIENRGRIIGIWLFVIIYVCILTLNLFNGKTSFEVNSLFFGFMAGNTLPKYKFTKNKIYLIFTIVFIIISIIALSCYVFEFSR